MDEYDKKAWDALEHERVHQLEHSSAHRLPQSVRDETAHLGEKARATITSAPWSDEAEQLVDEVMTGASDAATKVAAYSLSEERIVRAYQRAGNTSVQRISDIHHLGLRAIDDVKPHFDLAYSGAGALSGSATGAALTGGTFTTVAAAGAGAAAGATAGFGFGAVPGAGAGAAPGAAVVVSAMAADATAILLLTARVVFHTAAYYGYDVKSPRSGCEPLAS